MSEISIVNSLIFRLIALAIGVGCVGTAYDLLTDAKSNAKYAIAHEQLSYSKWNRMLTDRFHGSEPPNFMEVIHLWWI